MCARASHGWSVSHVGVPLADTLAAEAQTWQSMGIRDLTSARDVAASFLGRPPIISITTCRNLTLFLFPTRRAVLTANVCDGRMHYDQGPILLIYDVNYFTWLLRPR